MRKRIFGRRLNRDSNERRALFRNLMRELVLHGRMRTTEAKAKAIKGQIEKHVTKAIKQGDEATVHLQKHFQQDVITKIITDIAPMFKNRPGGYTRIIKTGNRVKDNAPMVIMEWVEVVKDTTIVEKKKRTPSTEKKTTVKAEKTVPKAKKTPAKTAKKAKVTK